MLHGKLSSLTFLAPPSPPGAPHIGGLYTWCLLDAARRAAIYFGGQAHLPQSWNLSSRRLEPLYGKDLKGFKDYCQSAIAETTSTFSRFGIVMSPATAIRDDDPVMRAYLAAVLNELAQSGVIRYMAAEEKWCLDCRIALPPTSAAASCFQCQRPLTTKTTHDWFLTMDMDQIFRRADNIRWFPGYALQRLHDLSEVHPLIRVGHSSRTLGVPSPFRTDDIVDPRLVGALAPSILRRLGLDDPIIAIAGFDMGASLLE